MIDRKSPGSEGRPRLGERGGQRSGQGNGGSACSEGRPRLGERGGHFGAPA
jgi:hypothetical protein